MAAKPTNWPYVINLGNSIIGVSVLAMPFCFKQCGLFLGILLLCSSAFLTRLSCSLLIKGAHTSRKRSYEYLALHTFGPAGKLCVELSIIGLLIGTCVAFFVIIGDLGPTLLSRQLGLANSWNLRTSIMVFLALFVALPLSLVKNVESLSNFSAVSIAFYTVFIAEVFITAFPNLWSGYWVANVVYWRPEGIFKSIPIFSLAFSCQTQMFVMYDALSDPSVKRIGDITKNAIGMCAAVYLCVGYFGYVAFCHEEISGDILLNFHPTIFSEAVKLGFVLSIAISFPLIIFPLRTAMYTLLFYKDHQNTEMMGAIYIPDIYVKGLSFGIILSTLVIGICLPNIEFVLAMTGATTGSMICFIFPAVMFISVMNLSNSHGKSTAQFVLFLGVTILLASTYVTLNSHDQSISPQEFSNLKKPSDDFIGLPPEFVDKSQKGNDVERENVLAGIQGIVKEPETFKEDGKKENLEKKESEQHQDVDDKRQEPPNPQEPVGDTDAEEKDKELQQEIKEGEKKIEAELKKMLQEEQNQKEKEQKEKAEMKDQDVKANEVIPLDKAEKLEKSIEQQDIKKENDNDEAQKLLQELKEQQKVQGELIEEQKNIIQELKLHQQEAHGHKEGDIVQNQEIDSNNNIGVQPEVKVAAESQNVKDIQPVPPVNQPVQQQEQQVNVGVNPAAQNIPVQPQGVPMDAGPVVPNLQQPQQPNLQVNAVPVQDNINNNKNIDPQVQQQPRQPTYDNQQVYQLLQNFLFNPQIQQNVDNNNNIPAPENVDTKLTELKSNLEKISPVEQSKDNINALLKDPNLLVLLKASENSQAAQQLRSLVNNISNSVPNQQKTVNSASLKQQDRIVGDGKINSLQSHQIDQNQNVNKDSVIQNNINNQGKKDPPNEVVQNNKPLDNIESVLKDL